MRSRVHSPTQRSTKIGPICGGGVLCGFCEVISSAARLRGAREMISNEIKLELSSLRRVQRWMASAGFAR
jgi:hypothetical protein